MFKICLLTCILSTIALSATIPPSPDFNITDFVGSWNVAGLFSTADLGLKFYSCATVTVTLGTLSRLTIDIKYINVEQYSIVESSTTVVPSPLNKAILVSTTSPSQQNNLVVTYYNATNGEAIIINPAATFGLILSRNENPYFNNFKAFSSNLLTNLTLSTNDVTYIFNRNCDTQKFQPLSSFDVSQLSGEFYGNAIYTTNSLFQGGKCFNAGFQANGHLLTVTSTISFNDGRTISSVDVYLPRPQSPAVLISAEIRNLPPHIIIYADNDTKTFLALAADGTTGFVFSQQQALSQQIQTQVTQTLNRNGLIVDSNTFYVLNQTCSSEVDPMAIYY